MKGDEFLDKLELVDPAFIEEAEAPKAKGSHWGRWAAAAACLCLLIGTFTLAAEAYEYREAVRFFDSYDLSTEGLTRGEIKEVYRDITTESFSYAKTAQVIQSNLSAALAGTEILQDVSTPEEVEALWELARSGAKTGVHYQTRSEYRMAEALGFEVHDQSYLERYDGEELVWSVSFSEFYLEDYKPVSGGVLTWGRTPTWSSQQTAFAWLAKVSDRGELLWSVQLRHGFQREYIAQVLENEDGTYAVFSRGDLEYLTLSQFSEAGEEESSHQTQVGNLGIWDAARLDGDYIVHLGNQAEGVDRIVRVDREGLLSDAFTYTAQDCDYTITGMAEFAGKLYLSAYCVPKPPEGAQGSRHEIAGVLDEIFARPSWEIEGEELTALLRDHYTAVLLVCDPQTGTPQTFYSVQGSLGGALHTEGEALLWDVESFSDACFSPATSAFSIAGTCQVFRCSFDRAGNLLGQEKTGEAVPYYR